jgi:predicted amidohydrolase
MNARLVAISRVSPKKDPMAAEAKVNDRVAAIQMTSVPDVQTNLREAGRLIAQAVASGARLVVLPENFAFMGPEKDKLGIRESDEGGPIQTFLAEEAVRHGIWIVGGTIPLAAADASKVYAACLVYDERGARVARYDKLHLFDVTLDQSRERYMESRTTMPGDRIVVLDSPFGRMGIAVCYDLRFPEIFRAQLDAGTELIVIPSAFTAFTGKAHWEILVRVRAIENQCYVIAAAQGGLHLGGRETYGDSMIVDPWGVIVDRLRRGAGVVTGRIDRAHLKRIRSSFPAIHHRRTGILLASGESAA